MQLVPAHLQQLLPIQTGVVGEMHVVPALGRRFDAGSHDNDGEQKEHEPQQEQPVDHGTPSSVEAMPVGFVLGLADLCGVGSRDLVGKDLARGGVGGTLDLDLGVPEPCLISFPSSALPENEAAAHTGDTHTPDSRSGGTSAEWQNTARNTLGPASPRP